MSQFLAQMDRGVTQQYAAPFQICPLLVKNKKLAKSQTWGLNDQMGGYTERLHSGLF